MGSVSVSLAEPILHRNTVVRSVSVMTTLAVSIGTSYVEVFVCK